MKNLKKNFLKSVRKSQRGFTMTELGVVLAVGGILAAAGISMVPAMMANIRADKVATAVNMAVPNIQLAFQGRPSFANLSSELVAKSLWIDSSFVSKENGSYSVVAPWADGKIEFNESSNATGIVVIANVPRRECLSLTKALFNNQMYIDVGFVSDPGDTTLTSVKEDGEVNLTTTANKCEGDTEDEASGTGSAHIALKFARA